MQRKRKLIYNTIVALFKQAVVVICGFIIPRYMLIYYGSEVNGAISSITQMLSFISLLEMGIGPVIQSNLYKPLANNDTSEISKIVKSSERFFRRIAYIFIGYVIVLMLVYPHFFTASFERSFTVALIVILSLSTLAQYYFGVTYQLLLTADQKAYVQLMVQAITIILNTILSVILITKGVSVIWVKLVTASIYVFRPLILNYYVHRHYCIDRKIQYDSEPIKQKWNGFAQHLATVVCGNTDVVVLTLFSSIKNVSVYSVYFNVTNGITSTVMTAVTGLEAFWGNMIARNEKKLLLETFNAVEWLIHTIVIVLFTITAILIVPFVKVYTAGVNDANYIAPFFGGILVLAYCFQCLRIPYFRIIKAAGHYKETQNGAIISMLLNILISVCLVSRFGLIGAGIGTFVALSYHTLYFVCYLRNHIIYRKIVKALKLFFTDMVIFALSIYFTQNLKLIHVSYISWLFLAIQVTIIVLAIAVLLNLVLYRNEIKSMLKLFIKKNK